MIIKKYIYIYKKYERLQLHIVSNFKKIIIIVYENIKNLK